MKKPLTIMMTAALIGSPFIYANSAYSHGVEGEAGTHGFFHNESGFATKKQILQNASSKVYERVMNGKLDYSWKYIDPKTVGKRETALGPEWVVSFENPKVSDETRKILYVFMDMKGEYIAANFTGK